MALTALGKRERLEVLHCCTRHMPLADGGDCLDAVAARLHGCVGADVAAVCVEAAMAACVEAVAAAEDLTTSGGTDAMVGGGSGGLEAWLQSPAFLAGLRVTPAHFAAAAAAARPSVLRGLAPDVPDDISFDAIGGLQVGWGLRGASG